MNYLVYNCKWCKEFFRFSQQLKTHLDTKHSNESDAMDLREQQEAQQKEKDNRTLVRA